MPRSRSSHPRFHPGAAFTVAGAMLLGGCATAPELDFETALPGSFSTTGSAATPAPWWTSFQDAALNDLEQRALSANFALASAWERFRQAQAVVDRETAPLFPRLDGILDGEVERSPGGSGSRSSFSGSRTGNSAGAGGGSEETDRRLSLGLEAAYEVDVWGRIRSQVEAARWEAEAARADYVATALTVSAEVATAWFQLVEAWAQRDLLDDQSDTNLKVQQQLQVRFGEGQGRAVDVLRQQQLVEQTREQKARVEAQIGLLENELAVLTGIPATGQVTPTRQQLPSLPPLPQTGVPLETLPRRPDVQAALHRMSSADQALAAAIRDQYPQLNLRAALVTAAEDASVLFDDWIRSIAADLVAPLIDGGGRRAEVRRSEAERAELVADYRQTLLIAIREVEDALVQEQKQREQIARLEEQVSLARRSHEQLLTGYLNGESNFIDVLSALTSEQQLRRDLLTSRRQLVDFRIALYRALAGGFEPGRDS